MADATPDPLAGLKKRYKNIPITGDAVKYHDGKEIIIPSGMSFKRAIETFKQLEADAETPTSWDREYKYRADDMAHAAYQVIQQRYGMLLGKTSKAFMGTAPAQTKNVRVSIDKTVQLPWGRIEIPVFEGLELMLGERVHKDYGRIGFIHAEGPRKYKDEVQEFFDAVELFLLTNSIYRGQALVGSNELDFLDMSKFRLDQIVFADSVTALLEGTIFAPIRHTEVMEAEGVSLKRAVLLYGPFGTGKTSAGQLTAKIATEHGWTVLFAKPGRDNIEDVMRTARLYEPSVVFIEDIDGAASVGEANEVSKLLDTFDGITAKGGKILAVMTTNNIEKIHKGMLRPGRLDAVIEIAELDKGGVERLIKAVVLPTRLDANVDFDAVYAAMEGFLPAFVKETLTRAVTFAIDRADGKATYTIGTADLVYAAQSLRPQLELQDVAGTGKPRPELDQAVVNLVREAIPGLQIKEVGWDQDSDAAVQKIYDPEDTGK